ncbi:DUF3299 domain-containing protein [Alteromonas sp. 14N.309.X.WAT.G.H12]|uniref:DUF3299 domain-containing protein n=1 Tax=Alteromonas sp. 14N.309.X.WAT.G.H12 TaxID=3120824 RepID=UPI002FD618B9
MKLANYFRRPRTILLALVCLGGVGIVLKASSITALVSQIVSRANSVYVTDDPLLQQRFEGQPRRIIGWSTLLPEDEFEVFQKYQSNVDLPLHEQIFTALQASFDDQYQSLRHSMETVPEMNNLSVQLSGFIVPMDTGDEHEILSFFLVPYYGACIHFPPPSPNQMVYVRTPGGLKIEKINEPISVSGILQTSMFEDPMGSSAYLMDAVSITPFEGQPDDVREHDFERY